MVKLDSVLATNSPSRPKVSSPFRALFLSAAKDERLNKNWNTTEDSDANGAQPHAQNNGHPTNGTDAAPIYTYSTFSRLNDNTPKAARHTWPQLCERLSRRTIREEKDGPLFSGASYPPDTPRGNAGVSFVSVAILDFDDGTPPGGIEASVSRLNSGDGCAAFIYSTHSHNPDEGALKYRLVLPLLEPVAASDWPRVWKQLALHFGGAPDESAKDAARIHFLPSCPPSRETFAVAVELDGPPLDVATLPELPPEPPRAPHSAPESRGGDNYARGAFERVLGRLAQSGKGNRNTALNQAALDLGHFVGAGRLDRFECEDALLRAAMNLGLPEDEARKTIKSGLDTGEREPNRKGEPMEFRHPMRGGANTQNDGDDAQFPDAQHDDDKPRITPGFPCTDTGNGERFAAMFGQRLRFARGLNWLLWAGTHWEIDECDRVFEMGKITARGIYQEAGASEDEDERKRLATHAKSSESASRRAAMLDLAAKDCAAIKAKASDFDTRDKSGWLFNCQNGTLDLRTGELFAHDKADCITRLAPVTFDPDATCPHFERFLWKVLGEDLALFEFVQKFIGYTLTGQTREQCFAILHGNGSNGKSTLLETLAALLGPYARPTDAGLLMEKHAGKVSNDLAALRGVRLVLAQETKEGRAFDEELVKRITGGDVVTARFLFKEFFDFTPDFKIWLCTNHQPTITGDDDGIWRRIRLIPFGAKFWDADKGESGPDELRADKTLPDKLVGELPGILNWAAHGALMWGRDGLGVPQSVADATGAYRASQDPITSFLECATVRERGASVSSSVLYRAFCDWRDGEDGSPMSQTAFSTRLQHRGILKKPTNNGMRFLGIRLSSVRSGEDGKPIWGDK